MRTINQRTFFLGLALFLFVLVSSGCASHTYVERSTYEQIYSPAMGREMAYSVYTPENWTPSESLPLMVLLHGARDDHKSFDKFGVGLTLDKAIAEGRAPRMIVVSPNGELGFWENWHDGSRLYRDWVVKDLMPHVSKQYSSLPCPEFCYISGISMGGHGAMRFAYYEPNTFSSVAAISAPIISKLHPGEPSLGKTILKWLIPTDRIWGDIDADASNVPKDLDPYISWVERQDMYMQPLLLVWGTEDHKDIVQANSHFQAHLAAHNKPHSWFTYEGKHKWIYWREIMPRVMRFHARQYTDESKPTPIIKVPAQK
ncbi:alpha/beta hydrolase [Glaciecola siphonariae]|uniref:Alpha/beta hydrolase n=1 Tax=Glaciecola siphonariae TaxID=521012 RepID=A0ABV9LVB2_9ALTE